MHFLNGGRLYLIPDAKYSGIEEQLMDCLAQAQTLPVSHRVYRINFFADPGSLAYTELTRLLTDAVTASFTNPVLYCLIAQPPFDHLIVAEVCYYDVTLWETGFIVAKYASAYLFTRRGARVLAGKVQCTDSTLCRDNAAAAFNAMHEILLETGFSFGSVIRQWNYIENIIGADGERQRYQEFNDVRSEFYNGYFHTNGYPAATGIGIQEGGVIIEFLAVDAGDLISLPIDNPEQVAAHNYSPAVLAGGNCLPLTTPKFERARYLKLFGRNQLFISGTASIRGEQTVGIGNAEVQTAISIENIQRLYSPEVINRLADCSLSPSYGHARVYIRNNCDYPVVKTTFRKYYGNLPVVYLKADICRNELLVEIEGKVILE